MLLKGSKRIIKAKRHAPEPEPAEGSAKSCEIMGVRMNSHLIKPFHEIQVTKDRRITNFAL